MTTNRQSKDDQKTSRRQAKWKNDENWANEHLCLSLFVDEALLAWDLDVPEDFGSVVLPIKALSTRPCKMWNSVFTAQTSRCGSSRILMAQQLMSASRKARAASHVCQALSNTGLKKPSITKPKNLGRFFCAATLEKPQKEHQKLAELKRNSLGAKAAQASRPFELGRAALSGEEAEVGSWVEVKAFHTLSHAFTRFHTVSRLRCEHARI